MSPRLRRGEYGFRITQTANLEDCPENVELLRRLWLGRELVSGDTLGPGDPGDYDYGAWHVSCHLVAAGGVVRLIRGDLAWLEISHYADGDAYYSSVTLAGCGTSQTLPLNSFAAHELLAGSEILGFVEGTSVGRISARGVEDPPDRFKGNPRQEYDEPPDSEAEGGKVWEHWCTLRDIRQSAPVGSSVLAAYVTLCSRLGDLFPATVTRGRRAYGHPAQLAAMVKAGFIGAEAPSGVSEPTLLPDGLARLFAAGFPEYALDAVNELDWSDPPRYYMFSRRIDQWNGEPGPIATE